MNTQYDLAIESFIMNFDESVMNDMIAEEGLKDALTKVKNALLAAIRWIVDKCKSLWRKITGKDKGEVGKIIKETQKIQKVVEKTDNPQVLSQAQEKVKEQKEKLEEVMGGGDIFAAFDDEKKPKKAVTQKEKHVGGDIFAAFDDEKKPKKAVTQKEKHVGGDIFAAFDDEKKPLSPEQKRAQAQIFKYANSAIVNCYSLLSSFKVPADRVFDKSIIQHGTNVCTEIIDCLNTAIGHVSKLTLHNLFRNSPEFDIEYTRFKQEVQKFRKARNKIRNRIEDYWDSFDDQPRIQNSQLNLWMGNFNKINSVLMELEQWIRG